MTQCINQQFILNIMQSLHVLLQNASMYMNVSVSVILALLVYLYLDRSLSPSDAPAKKHSNEISMARHHIIPKFILIRFWKDVVRYGHFDHVIAPFMRSLYANGCHEKPRMVQNISKASNAYLWMSCNLFIGPIRRSDDPGMQYFVILHSDNNFPF
eukprot:832065_1